MSQPPMEQLVAFAQLVERHQQRAAGLMGPATQALEKTLECQLVDRRTAQLNQLGRQLFNHAQALSKALGHFSQRPPQRHNAELVLAMDELVPSQALLNFYPKLLSELPLQEFVLRQLPNESLVTALEQGETDMLLRLAEQQKPPRTQSRRFCSMSVCWACAPNHPLAKRQQLSIEQVLQFRQLHISSLPDYLLLNPLNHWQVNQRDLLNDLLVLGEGWAIAPRHWLNHALNSGRLTELRLDNHYVPNKLNIELMWLSHRRDAQFVHCLNLLGVSSHE
ncbi:LysR family transcriptional regulator [Aliagarivorans taiwanensis]|uniref:LysR family transcriptional regulator n=1 Tax=Aliagarivorans taiwanensis TaxID=561966 RepID=UPI00040A41C9|nr:LysR family transcriptional regulator [Aliagarivorans taiwanensis]